MGLLDRLRERFAGPLLPGPLAGGLEVRQLGAAPWLPTYQVGKPSWPEQNLPAMREAFARAATIFACVTYRAHAVATAPCRVYRGTAASRAPDDAHPLRALMADPNPQMSEAEFWYAVQLITDVSDFCVVSKVRDNFEGVAELWPLRSDWLRPIPRTNSAPDWEYRRGGREKELLRAEDAIVVTAGTSPLLPLTGFGPMDLAVRQGALTAAMQDYLLGFWQGGALPPYGLVPRAVAEEGVRIKQPSADAMRAAWRQVTASGEPPILWSIERVERLGFDFDELAFDDLHALVDTDICKAFGVPPILIHAQVGLERATYSNYAQARQSFYEDTVAPLWARLDGAFTRALLREPTIEFADDAVELAFDVSDVPALQEDAEQRRRFVLDCWRYRVIDQATTMDRLGFPPVAGTEGVYYAPSTVDLDLDAFADEAEGDGGEGGEGTERALAATTGREKAIPATTLANGHGWRALRPEVRGRIADTNRRTVARLAERWADRLAAFWREQGERIAAAAVRSARSWDDLPDRDKVAMPRDEIERRRREFRDVAAINWDEEERFLGEVLRALHGDATAAAWGDADAVLSIDTVYSARNPYVGTVLDRLARRIVGIHETTRADVRRVVGQALDDGVTLADLADRLRGLFEETYRGRAETVGRTESMMGYNLGSTAAYRASGLVSFVELSDNPMHTDSYNASDGMTCATRHGIQVSLDRVAIHVEAEHPRGSLAVIPLLDQPLAEAE